MKEQELILTATIEDANIMGNPIMNLKALYCVKEGELNEFRYKGPITSVDDFMYVIKDMFPAE